MAWIAVWGSGYRLNDCNENIRSVAKVVLTGEATRALWREWWKGRGEKKSGRKRGGREREKRKIGGGKVTEKRKRKRGEKEKVRRKKKEERKIDTWIRPQKYVLNWAGSRVRLQVRVFAKGVRKCLCKCLFFHLQILCWLGRQEPRQSDTYRWVPSLRLTSYWFETRPIIEPTLRN